MEHRYCGGSNTDTITHSRLCFGVGDLSSLGRDSELRSKSAWRRIPELKNETAALHVPCLSPGPLHCSLPFPNELLNPTARAIEI
jgi:hypothetical protein